MPSDSKKIWISTIVKSNAVSFLWLKGVDAFDPSCHCARCLVGRYSKIFPYGKQAAGKKFGGHEIVTPDQILYLCGVTWRYENNLHVPMRATNSDAVIEIETQDFIVHITGAERIDFPALDEGYEDLPVEFTSCRNYQFGVHARTAGLIPTIS